jgi:hypothetical protein
VWGIAKAVLDIQFRMPTPESPELRPLPALIVLGATAIPAVGATVIYILLNWMTRFAAPLFWILALVFLIFSYGGPHGLPVDDTTKIALGVLHTVAALTITGILTLLPLRRAAVESEG